MTGTITIWRHSFAFITPDDGSANVFVPGGRRFRVGDRVRFAAVPNERRPGQLMATDIEVVGHGPLPERSVSPGRATTIKLSNFAGGGWRRA